MLNAFVITPITIPWKKLWSALPLDVYHLGNCPIALLSREFPILSWCWSMSIHNLPVNAQTWTLNWGSVTEKQKSLRTYLPGGQGRQWQQNRVSRGSPGAQGWSGARNLYHFAFVL